MSNNYKLNKQKYPTLFEICEHGKSRGICILCNTAYYVWQIQKGRIKSILKRAISNEECEKLIGCNKYKLKNYLQKQFKTGDLGTMEWSNFGVLFEIDHRIALKQLMADGSKPTEIDIIQRMHYTNLQPLWKEENRKWSNKQKCESAPIEVAPIEVAPIEVAPIEYTDKIKYVSIRLIEEPLITPSTDDVIIPDPSDQSPI